MRQHFRRNAFGLVAASVALASCGPLISIGDEGPADEVYTLRYEGGYPMSGAGPVVFVDEPTVVDGLNSDKVAVALADNRRATIDGVRWSAPPSDLVRDYLVRALADGSDARMVGQGGLDIKATCRLGVKLWEMDFVPGSRASDDRVSVAFELTLVRLKDNQLIGHPTIVKSPGVGGSGSVAVMAAFNDAMAQAGAEATAWFKTANKACDAG